VGTADQEGCRVTTSRRRNDLPDGCAIPLGIAFVIIFVTLIVVGIVSAAHQQDYRGCSVTDKDRARNSNGKSDARVYSSCGVFKVSDSLLSTTWSSADTYSRITVGKTYDFHARGYRIPFLSRFPNVTEATEVTK
jgi:hypothetical protein